jgi:RNA polymerase sigma-70 factor, ECF subfamily
MVDSAMRAGEWTWPAQDVSENGPIEDSDEALAALARDAPEAFAPLYERYADPIYRYCYRRLRDPDHAADLTSQIFLRALSALPRFDARLDPEGGGTFRAWLYTIARRLVVDAWRRERPALSFEAAGLTDQVIDGGRGPEEHAIAGDELAALDRALAQLTEPQRQIVELRLAGLRGPEIGRVLGMKPQAVKSAHFRAFYRLRALLTKEGFA